MTFLRYICKYIKINLFYLCVHIYTKIDNHLHSFNFFNFWFIILNGHNTSTKTMIIMTHLKDEIWICALIKNIKIKCRIHSNCYHLIFLSSHDFEYFGKNWVLKNILQWLICICRLNNRARLMRDKLSQSIFKQYIYIIPKISRIALTINF